MKKALFKALDIHFQRQTLCISFQNIRKNHYNCEIHVSSGLLSSPLLVNHELAFSGVPETTKWDTRPDEHELVQMIRKCTNEGHVFHGEQLHCYVLRSGFASNVFVATTLVSFYVKLLSLDDAHKLFDEIPQPNVVSWNTMISGYVHSGKLMKALHFFIELNKSDLQADAYSYSAALAACGQMSLLLLGMSIHSKIVISGIESSSVVANCLSDMYGKCGSVKEAIRIFNWLVDKDVTSWNSVIAACARNQRLELAVSYFYQMPDPDTISYNELISGFSRFGNIDEAIKILRSMPNPNSSSWNAIISGFVVRNRAWEALDLFSQMHAKGIVMDEYTFSSILSGVACISALSWGTLLHCFIIKYGLVTSMIIGSAIIDLYSKCGQVKQAEMFFHSFTSKNIVTWNAMISGLAHNGESQKVIHYFEELKGVKGMRPDDITFVNLLAACSHNEMPLERAYDYFTSMITDYGIEQRPEHLASIIRLMGHHGEVWRAEKMIYEIGFGTCISVWRALLGACGACGNLEVAKIAAAKVTELGGDDEFGYVALSNINKGHGNWVDATELWKLMRDRGVVKETGFSWIDGGDVIR